MTSSELHIEAGDLKTHLRGPLILGKLVVDSLGRKREGFGDEYAAIVEKLSTREMKSVVMCRWLKALKLCVSHLTRDSDLLVGATLRLDWTERDQEVVNAYVDYLSNLLSAQTCYLHSVLESLVKKFLLPSHTETSHLRTHWALQVILELVPTSPAFLLPLLRSLFPYKSRPVAIQVFEQAILTTHASSHIQFLVFWITSLHQSFPDVFLNFLWDKFQALATPPVIRQAAAAYIASYVARAKFVSLSTARLCLSVMMQWIHQYLENCSSESLRPDEVIHGVFYSLCQAVFYVCVFRHKALLKEKDGLSFLRQLNFEKLITSKCNPLKVCLSTVVELFASITSSHEIVFCYTILEQNRRLLLPSASAAITSPGVRAMTTGGNGRRSLSSSSSPSSHEGLQANLLDSFFPFDPFYLKRSAQYVSVSYQDWEGIEQNHSREEAKAEDESDDSCPSSLSSSCSLRSHNGSSSHGGQSPFLPPPLPHHRSSSSSSASTAF